MMQLNAYDKPPVDLKAIFKKYQKISPEQLLQDQHVIDLENPQCAQTWPNITGFKWSKRSRILHSFNSFLGSGGHHESITAEDESGDALAYEVNSIPGLVLIPSLIPVNIQKAIMSRLFHRDLQNANHKTNVHLHHHIEYPPAGKSFFDASAFEENLIKPKDPNMHKAMSVRQFLDKKLRWMTLGGQYDWTEKVYPKEEPPQFPNDLSNLLHNLFPQTRPEAAIVNLYSPGDTLSLHRDVSEDCENGLISLSIGCDALFVIGVGTDESNESKKSHLVMRIHSGDALYMMTTARYAWHGVPLILRNTCPKELQDWPCAESESDHQAETESYKHWQGWMASKRVNLNVRQMKG